MSPVIKHFFYYEEVIGFGSIFAGIWTFPGLTD